MKRLTIVILLVLCASRGAGFAAGREFLSPDEISSIRDEADAGKRVLLYIGFAKRRLDAVREKTVSKDPGAGETIQGNLEEYTSILDALADSLEIARQQRSPLNKVIQEMQKQGAESLKYLQSLASGSSPNRSDYDLTLQEAVDTTKDELENAKKGAFPEVKERKPPTDLPPSPPPPSKSGPEKSGAEEGPPRKPGRGGSQSPAQGPSEGPPRKQ
jgi:hypothetical protein